MALTVGATPVKSVYVGSTPVKAVYVGDALVWQDREVVQITLGPGYEARDQFRAALADRGLDYQTVMELPFDIELVGTGSLAFMLNECHALTTVPAMDTSRVTNMSTMFQSCSALTTVPAMDTSRVTNMSYMFNQCHALTTVPAMDTSRVTNMRTMFQRCESLTTVPEMNTSQVTDMGYMFTNAYSITRIPDLATSQVTNMANMFWDCAALMDGNVRLIGRHPSVDTNNMIAGSGLTREPFYMGDGQPWPTAEVYEVSLTDVRGSGTIHPLLTVTVPAGETWSVRIQGTMTKASGTSSTHPRFRIGATNSETYGQGAAVDFSGTVTAANSTIALVTNAYTATSFTGTVTIEK